MNKHYTYGKAIKHRGNHDIIIVDPKRLNKKTLGDKVNEILGIKPHNYTLINETQIHETLLKIAQHYKADLSETNKFYQSKIREYMIKEYGENNGLILYTTRTAKQYAINETYNKLQQKK